MISLEISKGHLRWKVTDLARQSGIGRELIYYHFGSTKRTILERSFELIAYEFYGLGPERTELVKSGNLLDSLRLTHKLFVENPSFGMFYIKWRTTPSPIQSKYIEIEKRYQTRLKSIYPHLTPHEVEALHSILHGIVTAPFLSEQGLRTAATWVDSILRPRK